MDAYRVIRHPGDEEEAARWACRAGQQRGPVEIAYAYGPNLVPCDFGLFPYVKLRMKDRCFSSNEE